MNIQHYFYLFLRYLWLILLLIAGALAAGWNYLNKQTPRYASKATILVNWGKETVIDIKNVKEDSLTGIDQLNSEVKLITSQEVMLEVAKTTGFSQKLAQETPEGRITNQTEGGVIGAMRSKISASLDKGTRLINIVAEETSPEGAANLANAVIDSFLKFKVLGKTSSTRDSIEFLVKETERLRGKLQETEKKLVEFREKNNLPDIEASKVSAVETRLSTLNSQLTEAQTKRLAVETDLAVIDKVDANDIAGLLRLSSVATLPEVAGLQTAFENRTSAFAALKQRYLQLHPKYISAQAELNDLKRRRDDAVRRAREDLKSQVSAVLENEQKLQQRVQEMTQEKFKLDQVAVPYNLLLKEKTSDEELYKTFETRLKEIVAAQTLVGENYTIVERAMQNPLPVFPRRMRTMVMAGLGALVLGVSLILLFDHLDSSVRTVDEAESLFQLPVMAAVPEGKEGDMRDGTVILTHPESAQAEAFRNLRASLSLLGEESGRRLFLVTSGIPGEGKTFTSTNLAASFAVQGFRTLLVDADLRRPALSANLLERDERKQDDYRGLSDVLSRIIKPEEGIRATKVDGLEVLPSGRKAPNPSELLSQPYMKEFLDDMLSRYDRVIVDSAPVNAVSDAITLGPLCHKVVLVIRYGHTPRRVVNRAVTLLKKGGASLVGTIMNRLPLNRGASYYYYYYGEGYHSNGKRKKK